MTVQNVHYICCCWQNEIICTYMIFWRKLHAYEYVLRKYKEVYSWFKKLPMYVKLCEVDSGEHVLSRFECEWSICVFIFILCFILEKSINRRNFFTCFWVFCCLRHFYCEYLRHVGLVSAFSALRYTLQLSQLLRPEKDSGMYYIYIYIHLEWFFLHLQPVSKCSTVLQIMYKQTTEKREEIGKLGWEMIVTNE